MVFKLLILLICLIYKIEGQFILFYFSNNRKYTKYRNIQRREKEKLGEF